ncbi:MAG TPA: ABC transporter transmembrane domain-containing protein, partial [Spirochaetales bacterium]|nr:ABC transporter transmembrane domain-containing protein [Spirochaetales bacterium]
MSDFFDSDEIVKNYDSAIIKRIFSYTKNHKVLLLLIVICLLISTIAELAMPIISQKIIDDVLIVSYVSVGNNSMLVKEISDEFPKIKLLSIHDTYFIRKKDFMLFSNALQKKIESEVTVFKGEYYIASVNQDSLKIVKNYNAELILDSNLLAIQLDKLKTFSKSDLKIIRSNDYKKLNLYGVLFFIAVCAALFGTFFQTWSTSLTGQYVMKSIRMQLFDKTIHQSLNFLTRQPVGRLVTRLTSDVETINEFFTDVVVAFIKDLSVMIGVINVLINMSLRLGLVAILSIPPVLIITSIARKKARDAFRKQRKILSKLNAYIAEHISGISIVKIFSRQNHVVKIFKEINHDLMKANLGEMYVMATFRPVIEFFSTTSIAVILWYGSGLYKSGFVSLGTLVAFVNLVRMFYSPLQDISEKFTILQSAMAGGERVFKLLDVQENIPDTGNKTLQNVQGKIEFKNVWFSYKENEWVLKDISFSVQPGHAVAIVGYTGAGKTTITSLLPRFWDIQKGEILLDDIPIREFSLKALRSYIRPVMQDVFLFSGTIAENIDLGLGLSREKIVEAA